MSTYSALILAETGLVSYWRLGESGGTSAADSQGTNTGTYTAAPTLGVVGAIPGDPDTAVRFTAASLQYVTVPNSASLQFGNGPLSFECWFKPASVPGLTAQYLMMKGLAGNASPKLFLSSVTAGQLVAYSDGWGPGAHSSVNITDTAWHHAVMTKDTGNNWKVYLDGLDVTVFDQASQTANDTNPLEFGRQVSATNYFDGSLDEIAVYNVVLTTAQVAAHAAAGFARLFAYQPVRIASRQVGPMALRRRFRQPYALPAVALAGGAAAALAGTVAAVSNLPTDTLTTGIPVIGSVAGQSALGTSALTTGIPVIGSVAGQSALTTAALTTSVLMTGSVAAVSNLPSDTLLTSITAIGSSAGMSSLGTAALLTSITAIGSSAAMSSLGTSALLTNITAVGSTAAISALTSAALSTGIPLIGSVAAVSALPSVTFSGGAAVLAGTVSAVSSVTGSIPTALVLLQPVVDPNPGGRSPTPYDDWTLPMDDEACLHLLLRA